MIILDAIVGNIDRHSGNFGFLRDSNTGEYVSMAPLFDFDHTLSKTDTNNNLINNTVIILKQLKCGETAFNMAKETINSNMIDDFKIRAQLLIDTINNPFSPSTQWFNC